MTEIGRLSEEDAAEDRLLRANASDWQMRLARALQAAAMPREDFASDFDPAPLYLRQAVAIGHRNELRDEIAGMLDEAPRPTLGLS